MNTSGVSNVEQYFSKTIEELNSYTTEHLLAIFTTIRRKALRDKEGNNWCENIYNLRKIIKDILTNRPHVERNTKQKPKIQKKRMKY